MLRHTIARALRSGVPRGGPYELIKSEVRGRVGLVTLHRPEALNALRDQLVHELVDALETHDADDGVGACVVTGDERAFAAGADIKEMEKNTFADCQEKRLFEHWEGIQRINKPIIAAVSATGKERNKGEAEEEGKGAVCWMDYLSCDTCDRVEVDHGLLCISFLGV